MVTRSTIQFRFKLRIPHSEGVREDKTKMLRNDCTTVYCWLHNYNQALNDCLTGITYITANRKQKENVIFIFSAPQQGLIQYHLSSND